jgi:hypothetical protein
MSKRIKLIEGQNSSLKASHAQLATFTNFPPIGGREENKDSAATAEEAGGGGGSSRGGGDTGIDDTALAAQATARAKLESRKAQVAARTGEFGEEAEQRRLRSSKAPRHCENFPSSSSSSSTSFSVERPAKEPPKTSAVKNLDGAGSGGGEGGKEVDGDVVGFDPVQRKDYKKVIDLVACMCSIWMRCVKMSLL